MTNKKKKKTSKDKKLKVMVAHDNKTPGHTTKVHKFAKRFSIGES